MTPVTMAGIASSSPCDLVYLSGLFMTGLIFGLTVCSFTCLPLVCSWVMGTQQNFRQGFQSALIFCGGRVGGYTVAGMACGLTGMAAEAWFGQGKLITGAGILFVLAGLGVAFSRNVKPCQGKGGRICGKPLSRPVHMGSLGLVTGMMPCIPYSAVMAGAAASGSALTGAISAFVFGLGTSISPILFVGGGAGWFAGKIAEKIPAHAGMLKIINGGVIVLMGVRMLAI